MELRGREMRRRWHCASPPTMPLLFLSSSNRYISCSPKFSIFSLPQIRSSRFRILGIVFVLVIGTLFLRCFQNQLWIAGVRFPPMDDVELAQNQSNELSRNFVLEGSCPPVEDYLSSPQTQGLNFKHRLAPTSSHLNQSDFVVLDIISNPSEDVEVGQTLKRPPALNRIIQEQKLDKKKEETSENVKISSKSDKLQGSLSRDKRYQRSCITLEVLNGPAHGSRCSVQSTNTSRLPLTLGRVTPCHLLVKDLEVSGRHAMINWNMNKMKWEVVDVGSLNGTLLNSQPINHPDIGKRHWGAPTKLSNGDIITLGTTSKVSVEITSQTECQIPFGVGMASDPMAMRRGGKKLPMEDVCYYRWPLLGIEKFGLFGICDGHGGAGAAKSASKILPDMVASILSDSAQRDKILSVCDASDVLRAAFFQTEASMNHHYEGCTATVLLIWVDGEENLFAQCANVGDSACIMNVAGKGINMTEDHRISSYSERLRIGETGEPLKDGEKRLFGLNLARILGDKFLKQQDGRFSSVPFVSGVVRIDKASRAFGLLASDGFWDVMSIRKATQLVHQMKERSLENSAEKIASVLLSEARTMRTKDNTSIIYLDFDMANTNRQHSSNPSSCTVFG